jgi:hypothetical protein
MKDGWKACWRYWTSKVGKPFILKIYMQEYLPILLQEISQYSKNQTSYMGKACILEKLR